MSASRALLITVLAVIALGLVVKETQAQWGYGMYGWPYSYGYGMYGYPYYGGYGMYGGWWGKREAGFGPGSDDGGSNSPEGAAKALSGNGRQFAFDSGHN